MSRDLILAIDSGTQSVRALAFDLQGNLIAKSRVAFEPYFSAAPGWAEHDPAAYWKSLCQACQRLWQQGGVAKEAVRGVALTTQRGTVVNVDRQGNALRPAILWLDQRRAQDVRPIRGLWGLVFRVTGLSRTIARLQAEAEANWIHQQQPEVWEKTHKYLLLSGYLTYRLTGRFVDSVACQVGYLPFDYKRHCWAAAGNWRWQVEPLSPEMLPELVAAGGTLGEITSQTAEETGIPAGLPVVAAGADKASEVLGAGCVEPHVGCIGYGTTATINTTHRRYVEVVPLIPPYPAAVPGAYSLEFQVFRGYWMVNWFKGQFGHEERRTAAERGVEPEALFDEQIRQIPPGAMGLTLQPYWTPGVRFPGPEAKGAVIGFGDLHTRWHLYRAILEGIAYALREGREQTERRSGVRIRELRAAGGGSQSDAAMQITADVLGLPAARPHVYEASGLGAAIDAAVGLKLHGSFEVAVREMTRVGRTFEPNPKAGAIYDELYRRVYRHLYGRLRPLYRRIRDITGYPDR